MPNMSIETSSKPNPENPHRAIEVNLPEDGDSRLFEAARDSLEALGEYTKRYLSLSNTPINGPVLKGEETNLFICSGKQGRTSGGDYKYAKEVSLLSTLVRSDDKVENGFGYYDEEKQGFISQYIGEKSSVGTVSIKSSHHEFASTSPGTTIFLGGYDLESHLESAEADWKEKHYYLPGDQGNMSDREYKEKLERYNARLEAFLTKLATQGNREVALKTFIFKETAISELNHEHFTKELETHITVYRLLLEAIYNVEGEQIPNLEINLTVPKPIQKKEKEVLVTVDEDIEAAFKEMVESQRALQKKGRLSWAGFEGIGGQKKAVEEAKKLVQAINNVELYRKRGVKQPKGILFYGPPGTGKTMLAKAIAKESGAEFYEISLADLGSKWHGESEKLAQALFDQANELSSREKKVIIFFDEIDALAHSRESSSHISRKVLSVILQNMDGMRSNQNVTIIGATNRPEDVDPAIKRSGRIDKLIEVGLPDKEGRISIFKIHMDRVLEISTEPESLFSPDIDYSAIGDSTDGMSGADLANLVNLTLEEKLTNEISGTVWTPITTEDVLETVDKMGRIKKQKKKLGF